MPCQQPAEPLTDDSSRRAAATYSAAADHYTAPALGFWDRYGEQTVRRLALPSGAVVLDLCCGAGGSALPAARAVGADGRVVGIDVAEPLLQIARQRAGAEGLGQVEFRCGDASGTGLPDDCVDAVVCVFGVFFASDMTSFVAEMARVARPGGTVAITTWGRGLFEPGNSLFWDAVGDVQPELYKAYNPWDSLTSAAAVTELLAAAGLVGIRVEPVAGAHPLASPEDFWDVALGSGYRATVDALSAASREAVKTRVLAGLRDLGAASIRTDVVFGAGSRPS